MPATMPVWQFAIVDSYTLLPARMHTRKLGQLVATLCGE